MRSTVRWMSMAALALAACGPAAPASPTAAPTVVPPPSAIVEPTAISEPTDTPVPALPFEAATYTDAAAGFEFDYPASWIVGPTEGQSRGGITAFTSWDRPSDVLPGETPPGETRLDATVQQWDPKGDLEAFLAQRMGAWSASSITIVSEERSTLADGRPTASYVVQGSDGAQAYFFFTVLGGDYLVLSGSGDLALLAEIAATLRRTAPSDY
jgi:hypothetical protein